MSSQSVFFFVMSSLIPHRSDVLIPLAPAASYTSFKYNIDYALPYGLLMIVYTTCLLIECKLCSPIT